MGNTLRSAATGVAALAAFIHVAAADAQHQQQWPQPPPQAPPPQQGWGQQPPPPSSGWGTDASAQGGPWGAQPQAQTAPAVQPPASPPPPPSTPQAAATTTAEEPVTTGAEGGWLLRARLPSAFPLGFVPHAGPQLEIGLVLDRLQLHVGLAITTGSVSNEYVDEGDTFTETFSLLALIAAPGVSYTTYRSADQRARMIVQGRALVGTLSATGENGRSESAIAYGLSVSALGEYRVHRAFGTGIEAGYGLAFASNSGRTSSVSGSMTGLFVAFTGTLYLGG